MPILFNTLLQSVNLHLKDVRLIRHMDHRSAKGRTPYELWRDDRPSFEVYQRIQSKKNEVKLDAPYWASFVGTPNGETLFVGLYSVSNRRPLEKDTPKPQTDGTDVAGSVHEYDLQVENALSDLAGKLLIHWGDGSRAWIQRPERQNKEILELRTAFKEPAFPGFMAFQKQLAQLESLPPSWQEVLSSTHGIYLLVCPKTREQYVGSATGEGGFWQRWQDYIKMGHGGNVALKSRDPSDYQVSILEVAGSSARIQDILDMEFRWKSKLMSREMGLNRN